MKKRLALCTFALVLVLAAPIVFAVDLPDPPAGFAWKQLTEIKAAFLMPDGWHFKRGEQKGTLGYFITVEDIDKTGRFDTGLTLNVKLHLTGRDAVEYAKQFVAKMGERNELVRSWETELGLLHGYGCLTRSPANDDGPSIMMHTLAIGNSRTNTLYILWFESLEPEWTKAWETGQKMLEMFVLDDEV